MKPSRKQTTTPKRAPPTPKFKTPLQKAKDPVEVFCRIRPEPTSTEILCIRKLNNVTVQLLNPEELVRNAGKEVKGVNYTYSYVFDSESTQSEIFEKIALPLIDDFLHFKSGLLFAYGVTSSGKTFTITGSPENCGILPRTLDVIFNSIDGMQARKYTFKSNKANGFFIQTPEDALTDINREACSQVTRTPRTKRREAIGQEWSQRVAVNTQVNGVDPIYHYTVFITFIEIYNNYVYDLLEEDVIGEDLKRRSSSKQVREDGKRNMYVVGVTEMEVRNADETFELFQKGQQRRKVGNTVLNTNSSRSHSILTIKLVRAPVDSTGSNVLLDESLIHVTQLSLVDLAGSERSVRTGNTGFQLKEAGNINNSLMVLRQCLEALRERQQTGMNKFIPFRLTKLTHLFRSYFEEEGKVRVIVCAHPGSGEYEELVHVMKFAEMAQDVLIARPLDDIPPIPSKLLPIFGSANAQDSPMIPHIMLPEVWRLDDATSLVQLSHDLTDRRAAGLKHMRVLNEHLQHLRDTFIEIQNQNSAGQQQIRTLEMDLKGRDHQLHVLERKMSADEIEREHHRHQMHEMEKANQEHKQQFQEKDYLLKKEEEKTERLRHEMEERIKFQRYNDKRIMDSILAQKQAELEGRLCLNQEKFQMLKDILNAGDGVDSRHLQQGPGQVRFTNLASSVSDPYLNADSTESHPRRSSRLQHQMGGGPPTSNPRRARSQSADGGKWVEHKPEHCVDTGTIFQAQMRKKKSLTTLNAKDLCNEKGSGYVLTHQEQDCHSGDVETQLFKGSILPSSAGGVQVVFNDVEVVRQRSPKKRSAENDVALQQRTPSNDRRPPTLPKKPRA